MPTVPWVLLLGASWQEGGMAWAGWPTPIQHQSKNIKLGKLQETTRHTHCNPYMKQAYYPFPPVIPVHIFVWSSFKAPWWLGTKNLSDLNVTDIFKVQHGTHFLYCVFPKISVLMPDSPNVPSALRELLLENTQFYRIDKLPLHQLCAPAFLQAFLNKGRDYLSIMCIRERERERL